ncbi:hypothetical protein ACQP1O_17545 [Nocardia sp. CA-151230]|uniref:hypothetical protein n=1 Tax=Nocardia sp. CA-151230 TaxID=3239982 RepID=UPI003D9346A7
MVGVAGCSWGAGQQYKAGFSELPARCSEALKPAEQEVKAFAGEAYGSVAESADADREVTDTSQGLTCVLKFGSSVQREPIKAYRTPMWRNVSISYFLSLYPISANATPRNLEDYVPGSTRPDGPRPTPIAGVGEAALTWVKESKGDPPRVSVKFSINNLIVTVETWGKDWSGVPETFPIIDSPELRSDLRTGTDAIAKSIARQAPSALPTAMLTRPSLTGHTSRPTTTKVAAPAWDPCQISEGSLTGAGLDVGSEVRSDNSADRAACMWSGGWYRLQISSSVAPFEWSVYEDSTYVGPKPVTIGDHHGVQVRWRDSNLWCVLVFELPVEANLPDKGGRTLTFEASLKEDRTQTALCDELTRVVHAISGSLPATT